MKAAAIQRTSFVDYPGKIAAVIFTPGCNLDCFYCHNRALLCTGGNKPGTTPPSQVLEYLRKRRGLVDGVVLSGGEPTLQSGLPDFIHALRAMGYHVKLDTNGTRPMVLASLLDEGLVDYVAMDVKAPPGNYNSVCGVSVDQGSIGMSINLLLSGRVDYEFRTTVIPQLTEADILAIGRRIRGARLYVLQQYRRPESATQSSDPRLEENPHSQRWVRGVLRGLEDVVQRCGARGSWSAPPVKTERKGLHLPQ